MAPTIMPISNAMMTPLENFWKTVLNAPPLQTENGMVRIMCPNSTSRTLTSVGILYPVLLPMRVKIRASRAIPPEILPSGIMSKPGMKSSGRA